MKKFLISFLILLFVSPAFAGRAPITAVAADPYASALLIDADSGKVLFADNENAVVYPASVLKLMDLLTILDLIDQGKVRLDDMVQVTDEAYKMGGSQVYLDPSEQFSVEDLLYALMVQSANDAAVALAIHVAGSKEAFVAMMNSKAAELGMTSTHFYSVHGLPPATGQKVDVTTAHDFAILCRELAKRPEVFPFTETRVRDFRNGEFVMRTHNHLLGKLKGCDGFKTGYFKAAGFSIAATAKRNGVRLIALVMGSQNRKVRDAKAMELINRGFTQVPPRPESLQPTAQSVSGGTTVKNQATGYTPASGDAGVQAGQVAAEPAKNKTSWNSFFIGAGAGFVFFALLAFFLVFKRSKRNRRRPRF
jgi:D-alanyl-D-alanine carboxypeptidase (penicillin-binding protein 5/6)